MIVVDECDDSSQPTSRKRTAAFKRRVSSNKDGQPNTVGDRLRALFHMKPIEIKENENGNAHASWQVKQYTRSCTIVRDMSLLLYAELCLRLIIKC
jgi:hypothetical protein